MQKMLLGIVALILVGYAIYSYRQPRFVAGELATDFEFTAINGETSKLSNFKGQYVLVQFWGSWCGPCRAENPYLTKIYKQFNPKGFTILSIGIEKTETAWKKAISNDELVWPNHTMESQDFGGPIARAYNIHNIPTTYLINPEGKIMGVNLRHEIITRMLTEALGTR